MSKLIHEYENTDLLKQIRYVILSNVNEEYPYYRCEISNETYDNFSCCFNKTLEFKFGNSWKGSTENIRINTFRSGTNFKYYRYDNNSSCTSGSYSQVNQDLEFTNVANNKTGLIDLIADTKFYTSVETTTPGVSAGDEVVSGSTDFTTLIPYFVTIIAVLMLIFMKDFIKSCFYRRV